MLQKLIFTVILNNVTHAQTHGRTHNIASPWAPCRSQKSFWSSYLSQVRHCGCQLEPRAFITLPSMMKSEHLAQQDAKSTWKSCLQYFLPSNSKNVPSYKNYFPRHIKWYSSFHHLEWLKTLCTHKASCMI